MEKKKIPEKILGILGGMGPAASAEFMRLMAERAPVSKDQEHARSYLLSDPGVPDRSSAILGVGEDSTDRLKKNLLTLTEWGADLLAVPCNTAHYFIDRFREELPVPFIHIIEETVKAASEMSPEGAWLLATRGTMDSGLYQRSAKGTGYSFYEPVMDVQHQVQESINLV
ncbi:MAG: aspartate/glutamate racemase family protein, partial [Synergistaceae bacterium]|nr:aspartate/glutamate racemase family protein [Synergistaceae bacterium]